MTEGMEGKRRRNRSRWLALWAGAALGTPVALTINDHLEQASVDVADSETAPEPLRVSDPQYEDDAVIIEAQAYLFETYGVRVRFGGDPGYAGFTSEPLTLEQARTSLEYLRASLDRYPEGFFARNGVPEIRIGRELQVVEHPFFPEEERAPIDGLHMPWRSEVLLEFSVDGGFARFVSVLDHELYHWLDGRRENQPGHDAQWAAMHNRCECQPYSNYVNGEVIAAPGSKRDDLAIWFFDIYGSRTPGEDKATMANILLSPADHLRFLERLEQIRDVVGNQDAYQSLRDRYDAVRRDYFEWSGGTMDDAYWERFLAEARRSEIRYETVTYDYTDYTYEDNTEAYGTWDWVEPEQTEQNDDLTPPDRHVQ